MMIAKCITMRISNIQGVMRVVILLAALLAAAVAAAVQSSRKKCELVPPVEMCRELPYNGTSFPNLAGDETAKDASDALSTFEPLVNVGCSSLLRFFLCSVYFPMCNEKIPNAIGPCRPMCETVKRRCMPLLKDFGFPWPAALECSRFPLENNNEAMCMPGPSADDSSQPIPSREKLKEKEQRRDSDEVNTIVEDKGPLDSRRGHKHCPPDAIYVNKSAACIPVCTAEHGIKGLQTDRETASTFLFIFSLVSVVMTSICIITTISRRSDRCHRSFPETALLNCAAAFAGSSIVYLLSLLFRDQISCTAYASHQLFIVSSVTHVPCNSAAVLLYYFGTAGRLWWIVLAYAWHSSSSPQSGPMERLRPAVEMLTWALPLLAVMAALVSKSVSADPLSGICYVGAASKTLDSVFNLLRDVVCVIIAAVPLLVGCLVRVGRSPIVNHQSNAGSSALFGLIGLAYLVAGLFYMLSFGPGAVQQSNAWDRSWNLVSAVKVLIDPILGSIAAGACLITLLMDVFSSYRSPLSNKAGYVPAVPRIPQPAVPSVHTYTSTPRNNTIM
ncbi:hypothetical protein PMAYCL1PPCAC_21094 [Pristionchus mayeri]|uniref:Frizzled-4 n=1 Tax=Pristionchus mayeri TaxID=1317129 RepID=A0AAN5CUM6_9BILA|nr:hypothetical protein PMAYCL1PPCAC_21094 [Pristionchus mayeri]